MARQSSNNRQYLNTSIRLFRNKSSLNTSRKILQKSINQSIHCTASLKSNNASLAKRVAELQVELNSQRTKFHEANTELLRLRMENARLRACLESKSKAKEMFSNMRDFAIAVCDAGMGLLRSINDLSPIIEDGNDGSVLFSSNFLSQTAADMSNLMDMGTLKSRPLNNLATSAAPSPIAPRSKTAPSPHGMILLRRPVPDTQNSFFSENPSPYTSSVAASILESPVSTKQPVTVLVELKSPPISESNQKSPEPQALPEANDLSPEHVIIDTHKTPDRLVTPERSSSANPSPSPTTPVVVLDHLTDVQAIPDACPSPILNPRAHLNRAARLKSQPVIDQSSIISPPPLSKAPTKSKRRRLYQHDDSDDEVKVSDSGEVNLPDDGFKVPAVPRTVEVHMKRPGQVAFRAEAKHVPIENAVQPGRTGRSKKKPTASRSKPKPPTAAAPSNPAKPKNVFDLSANQTINMSVLPPTLHDFREQTQAKRAASQQEKPLTTSEPTHSDPPSGSQTVPPIQPFNPTQPKSSCGPKPRYRRLCLNDEEEHADTEENKENRPSAVSVESSSKPHGRTRSKTTRQK